MEYESVLKLLLERGFFFPSSEIYSDAPAGFWEAGPLGLGLRNRFVDLWRRELIRRDGMIEMEGSQIMPASVFRASGHLESFADPIATCKQCKSATRIDKLLEKHTREIVPEGLPESEYQDLIERHDVKCPSCGGQLDTIRLFNMMFRLGIGAGNDDAYLRPETCQSIFVDFLRLFKVMRCKLPIGIAQHGKSFRNEISPRQSLIRLREFYQAEIEIFFNPDADAKFEKFEAEKDTVLRIKKADGTEAVQRCADFVNENILPSRLAGYYLALLQKFYGTAGLDLNRARFRELGKMERAFYSSSGFDFEVETSIGGLELVACNYRGDYDLSRHSEVSKRDIHVMDGLDKVVPHVFELSMGVDRSLYAILEHNFREEEQRVVLGLKPFLAPIQAGVFPLITRDGLPERAQSVYRQLCVDFSCFYDGSGSIGRRYRRGDEAGFPFAITVDHQTLSDGTVTIRYRDSMEQSRVSLTELSDKLRDLLAYS